MIPILHYLFSADNTWYIDAWSLALSLFPESEPKSSTVLKTAPI